MSYKFLQIVDAIACINQRVNLIGIVTEINLPKTTVGTDLFCAIKIIDESQPSNGLSVRFFGETMDKLPFVHSVGDIVLVSRVLMKVYDSKVYAMYNKKYSSFAIFGGGEFSNNDVVPYQNSPNYKAREEDKKFVVVLRNWSVHHKIEGLNDSLLMREIKERGSFNLICKILHVCEVKKGEWMLFVWDGTDAPPASVDANLEDEMENPLPLQMEPSLLSRDILCTFPPVGTVLRMIIDQGKDKIGINFIHPKRWVKFFNIKFGSHAALWQAVLMPSSRLCYLPDDNDIVLARQRSHDERVPSRWGRMPFTSVPWPSHIVETDHPKVPFSTLMDVLTYPQVAAKFRCVVRVVAMLPWRAEDFRSPSGIYRVRVTLEDPTARVHALIYKVDGVKFFGNVYSADILTRKRNALLGIDGKDGGQTLNHVSRNPPWIQCCLRSYYTDKTDMWGTRHFRIFGSTLVC